MNKRIAITLIEGKQFTGERHYNQCVGVLSPPLPQLMEGELGIPFPGHLTRSIVKGYTLYSGKERIELEGEHEAATAVRRIHYDDYMLDAVKGRDIEVLSARAVDLEFHADYLVVYTDSKPVEGEVIVGAFGLDEGSASVFSRVTAYRPPQALSSIVTKYHPGPQGMRTFGNHIHAFLPRHPRIEFGGITPKGNHLTINIAGRAVDVPLMKQFLKQPLVRKVLPDLEHAGLYDTSDLRFFKGRFPYAQARNYYGDRYVMVGDASGLVRSFKGKGVTSAVMTGIRAANTILSAGISRSAFKAHYQQANKDIIRDLPYGRAIRLLIIAMARVGILDRVVRAAHGEPLLREALFGAVSGHIPYYQVWAKCLTARSLRAVLRNKGL
ncbi:MAG: hypothetical protein GTO14_03160, partial [Anaerolineales bacterium]|nr:hypothetical protein [Anaerolineales bacterium]